MAAEGQRVILCGLARTELNGRRGRTTPATTSSERIGVILEPHGEPQRLAISPKNLFFSVEDRPPAVLGNWMAAQQAQRDRWRGTRGGRGTLQLATEGPKDALGPGYPHGRELDPIRYMFLRGTGRF